MKKISVLSNLCILVLITTALKHSLWAVDADAATQAAYTKSYELEAKKDYAEALKALSAARFEERDTYFYALRVAWLNYLQGKKEDALTFYDRAASIVPGAVEPLVGRIVVEVALLKWDDVDKTAQAIIRLDPKNYTAHSSLAYARFCRRRYLEAKKEYEDVLKLYPSDATMQAGLGWSLLWLGRRREGVKVFRDILDVYPSNDAAAKALGKEAPTTTSATGAIYQRSYQAEALGNYADAVTAMADVSTDTKQAYFYNLRCGWLYYSQGQYAQSVTSYAQAAGLATDAVQPLLGKVQSEMALSKWDDALKTLDALLALDTKNYGARSKLGYVQHNLGHYKEAEDVYVEILREYPADLSARSGLAWAYLKQAKKTEAIREFKAILRVYPLHDLAAKGLDTALAK